MNCSVFGYEKHMPEVYEEGIWKSGIRLGSGKIVAVELRSIGTTAQLKIVVKIFQKATKQEKDELT